jgi:transposase InsO family protein
MQALKLKARPKAKFVHTTDSELGLRVSPNLLDRKFVLKKLNTVWVSDVTYTPTDKGWRYLTVILVLAERAVVGWTIS